MTRYALLQLLLLALLLTSTHLSLVLAGEEETCDAEDGNCNKPNQPVDGEDVRVITEEELKTKIGKGGEGDVWLAVMGEVYDVTAGRQYYQEGASYSFFAGRDASPSYASGNFNEEALQVNYEELTVKDLQGIEGWRTFYQNKDEYKFVGVMEGPFYGKEGKPTELLEEVRARLASLNAEKEAEKES